MGTVKIRSGVEIVYRLRPSDRPKNPQRLWHGRVKDVYTRACKVCLTEPGYEGLDELIFFEQIVSIQGELHYASSTR